MSAPKIKVGQIWREVDPRFERYIRVRYVCTGGSAVAIETVIPCDECGWIIKPRSRRNQAAIERFNSKCGGYVLHENVKP